MDDNERKREEYQSDSYYNSNTKQNSSMSSNPYSSTGYQQDQQGQQGPANFGQGRGYNQQGPSYQRQGGYHSPQGGQARNYLIFIPAIVLLILYALQLVALIVIRFDTPSWLAADSTGWFIVSIIITILLIVLSIYLIRSSNKPEKSKPVMVWGIILSVIAVLGLLSTLSQGGGVSSFFGPLIILTCAILITVGASKTLKSQQGNYGPYNNQRNYNASFNNQANNHGYNNQSKQYPGYNNQTNSYPGYNNQNNPYPGYNNQTNQANNNYQNFDHESHDRYTYNIDDTNDQDGSDHDDKNQDERY